jgi:hypothetical protein
MLTVTTKRTAKRVAGSILAAGATCAFAVFAPNACITAPPADLPEVPQIGPIILQGSVQPSPSQYLTELPLEFCVPVRVFNTDVTWVIYVDFVPSVGAPSIRSPKNATKTFDGGIEFISFTLTQDQVSGGPGSCHTIQVIVADQYQAALHQPMSTLGADSVTWFYSPNGPGVCDQLDGGYGAPRDAAPVDALAASATGTAGP